MVYFQEPRNLHYESDGFLYFNGANQEEDDGEYLFVGYDVYYYFSDSKNAKKAMVRMPSTPDPDTIWHESPHSKLISFVSDTRFPSSEFSESYLRTIYQYVTFPVTEDMIDDVLEKNNNDNVKICFHNSDLIESGQTNPKQNSSSYIIMEELFPNYSEYSSQSWADEVSDDFRGFLDRRYCEYKGIGVDKGTYIEYDIYMLLQKVLIQLVKKIRIILNR